MAIVLRCGHKNNTPYLINILTSVNWIVVIFVHRKERRGLASYQTIFLISKALELSKKLIWIVGNHAVDAALGKLLQGTWAIDGIDVGKEIRPACNLYRQWMCIQAMKPHRGEVELSLIGQECKGIIAVK